MNISEAMESLPEKFASCAHLYLNTITNEANLFFKSPDFDNVIRFVTFFDFPRSWHTWIDYVLDASPNALVANEVGALQIYDKHISKKIYSSN